MANYKAKGVVTTKRDLAGGAFVIPTPAEAAAASGAKASGTKTYAGKSSGGSSSGGSSGGGSSGGGAPAINYQAELQRLVSEMYETTFASEPIAYDQLTEDELSTQIASWLRPNYDQAILTRNEQTKRYNAELDADAISRGMGASTFVTDVKSRNMRDEARDIALLESEYGATLSKNVAELLSGEKDRALEVAMFNKEQSQFEYELAYDAATVLLATMGGASGGGGRSASRRKSYRSSSTKVATTSYENCKALLAVLSPSERDDLFSGSTSELSACRDEIIASVGLSGYYELQSHYA